MKKADIDYFAAVDELAGGGAAVLERPAVDEPATQAEWVRPVRRSVTLLLTALSAVSHHDPAKQDGSNTLLFNRQKQILPAGSAATATPEVIEAFCAANPVPVTVGDVLTDITFAEFVAVSALRLFLDLYNSADGVGLFSGMSRYDHLESRAMTAAVQSTTLRGFWDRLAVRMQAPIHPGDRDQDLARFWRLPRGTQESALRALASETRTVMALGRLWHSEGKLLDPEYAARVNKVGVSGTVTLCFQETADREGGVVVVDVPAVTSNAIRHAIREAGWRHLCQAVGIKSGRPGFAELPAGAEAIFVNGGNIAAGAKQPTNPFGLAWEIRTLFPLLDLLGGVTDSFDLGESRLSVLSVLVCRENADTLREFPNLLPHPKAEISVWDMLDDVTHTRQATEGGVGQMIFTFETLCKGAQIAVRFTLSPNAPLLTQGALYAAVDTYLTGTPVVGGQSARGFGHVTGITVTEDDIDVRAPRQAYEEYLATHRDEIKTALLDGTLGASSKVVS